MQFIFKGPSRDRKDITGVRFVPSQNGPIYILQHPLWEISQGTDFEPDESEEEYKNRKAIEGEVSFNKMNNLYVAGIDGIDLGQ
jgi:hypothetical protein